jgi:hypothetical protein
VRLLRSPHRDVALVDHYRTGMDGTVVSISGGVISSVIPPHLQQEDFSFAGKYKTVNIHKLSSDLCAARRSTRELTRQCYSRERWRCHSSAVVSQISVGNRPAT